jgi:hypothetical protein
MVPKKFLAAAISVTAMFALAACSNDDDNDNNAAPTVTATETASPAPTQTDPAAEDALFNLHCPAPIGDVQAKSAEDQWAPAYVVGSDVILDPVAFGTVTYTDLTTGETNTEAPVTKTGADQTGAIECTFDAIFEGPNPDGTITKASVEGTVFAVQR